MSYLRHLHRTVPAFFERSGKSAFAFTSPYLFPDDFARVRLDPSGRTGQVWLRFFLSEAEVQFAEREGFEALLTWLEEAQVDVSEVFRPSSV